MLLYLSLLALAAFAGQKGSMCQKMSYSVFTKAVESNQKGCKGKLIKGLTCAEKKCTADECRMACTNNDKCKFYYFGVKGACKLYASCIPERKNERQMGATYVKTSHGYAGTIGISWANFAAQERWATDEAAMVEQIENRGGMYVAKDANGDPAQQNADIAAFAAMDVDALIILAEDASMIDLTAAHAKNIPVIAYDRLIEDEKTFYITFDNVEVGRLQAQALLDVAPTGKYAFVKGSETDPNAQFVYNGQREILDAAIQAGDIEIVSDTFTPGWNPATAASNFEPVLSANMDIAAVASSNDGMAGGIAGVLEGKGVTGVALSGQDADVAALSRVASGKQTVSVFKDARVLGSSAGALAVQLGTNYAGFAIFKAKCNSFQFETPGGKSVSAIFESPIAITKENLDFVIDAGWVTANQICADALADVAACKSAEI